MRGSVFFHGHRLGVRESDRNFLIHKQMLSKIKKRQNSRMMEAQGVVAVPLRTSNSYNPYISVSGKRPKMDFQMRVGAVKVGNVEDDFVVIGDESQSKVSKHIDNQQDSVEDTSTRQTSEFRQGGKYSTIASRANEKPFFVLRPKNRPYPGGRKMQMRLNPLSLQRSRLKTSQDQRSKTNPRSNLIDNLELTNQQRAVSPHSFVPAERREGPVQIIPEDQNEQNFDVQNRSNTLPQTSDNQIDVKSNGLDVVQPSFDQTTAQNASDEGNQSNLLSSKYPGYAMPSGKSIPRGGQEGFTLSSRRKTHNDEDYNKQLIQLGMVKASAFKDKPSTAMNGAGNRRRQGTSDQPVFEKASLNQTEETNRENPTSFQNQKRRDKSQQIQIRHPDGEQLFPYPQGNVSKDVIKHSSNSFAPKIIKTATNASHKKLINLSFQERQRQREIDIQNRILLKQLLTIEKDFNKMKKSKDSIDLQQSSTGFYRKDNFNSISAFAGSPNGVYRKTEFHAATNKRKQMQSIDEQNARLYEKLKNQSCVVDNVFTMKVQYSKAVTLKNRISKTKRAPVGVKIPNQEQQQPRHQRSTLTQMNLFASDSRSPHLQDYQSTTFSHQPSFQDVKSSYYKDIQNNQSSLMKNTNSRDSSLNKGSIQANSGQSMVADDERKIKPNFGNDFNISNYVPPISQKQQKLDMQNRTVVMSSTNKMMIEDGATL